MLSITSSRSIGLFLILAFPAFLLGCESADDRAAGNAVETAQQPPADERAPEKHVVEVNAFDHAFSAPTEIPSGWITFRLNNERAEEIHELSLARIPKAQTYQTYREEVIGGWETIWDGLRAGEIGLDELDAAVGEHLPEWAFDVEYVNARNLLSPGRTGESILQLEPGTYAMECWVKNAAGDIHVSHGMIRELTVTDEDSGASKPQADLTLRLGSDGIVSDGPLGTGTTTIGLMLEADEDDGIVHGDVHLLRMTDETDLAEVARWMDWYDVERGLRAPAPADFLGGYNAYGSMPPDGRAWFTVTIDEPGQYAWIIEGDPEDEPWKVFAVE